MALRFFYESRWLSECSILANLNRKPPVVAAIAPVTSGSTPQFRLHQKQMCRASRTSQKNAACAAKGQGAPKKKGKRRISISGR
jgi:hypothetical protein